MMLKAVYVCALLGGLSATSATDVAACYANGDATCGEEEGAVLLQRRVAGHLEADEELNAEGELEAELEEEALDEEGRPCRRRRKWSKLCHGRRRRRRNEPSTQKPATPVGTTQLPATEKPTTPGSGTPPPASERPTAPVGATQLPTTEEPTTPGSGTPPPASETPTAPVGTTQLPTTEEPTTPGGATQLPVTEKPTTKPEPLPPNCPGLPFPDVKVVKTKGKFAVVKGIDPKTCDVNVALASGKLLSVKVRDIQKVGKDDCVAGARFWVPKSALDALRKLPEEPMKNLNFVVPMDPTTGSAGGGLVAYKMDGLVLDLVRLGGSVELVKGGIKMTFTNTLAKAHMSSNYDGGWLFKYNGVMKMEVLLSGSIFVELGMDGAGIPLIKVQGLKKLTAKIDKLSFSPTMAKGFIGGQVVSGTKDALIEKINNMLAQYDDTDVYTKIEPYIEKAGVKICDIAVKDDGMLSVEVSSSKAKIDSLLPPMSTSQSKMGVSVAEWMANDLLQSAMDAGVTSASAKFTTPASLQNTVPKDVLMQLTALSKPKVDFDGTEVTLAFKAKLALVSSKSGDSIVSVEVPLKARASKDFKFQVAATGKGSAVIKATPVDPKINGLSADKLVEMFVKIANVNAELIPSLLTGFLTKFGIGVNQSSASLTKDSATVTGSLAWDVRKTLRHLLNQNP